MDFKIKKIPLYCSYMMKEAWYYARLALFMIAHPSCLRYVKYSFTKKRSPIPWFTYTAIDWVRKYLRKDMNVFEWGSGGSTMYISKRAHIVSIEHDKEWFDFVGNKLGDAEYRFIKWPSPEYIGSIGEYPDGFFDLVIIDGHDRDNCAKPAMPKIKPGGAILIDNSEQTYTQIAVKDLESWDKVHFWGTGPYNHYFWRTSVFFKPTEK